MNAVSPDTRSKDAGCEKCYSTNEEVYIDIKKQDIVSYAKNLFNISHEHQSILLCNKCAKELFDHHNENATETLSWNYMLASQSSGNDTSESPPFIKPGPKSYKRRIAEELGLSRILEENQSSEEEEEVNTMVKFLMQQPEFQHPAKKARLSRQNNSQDSVRSRTADNSSSQSLSAANIFNSPSFETIPNIIHDTSSEPASEPIVIPEPGTVILNSNDFDNEVVIPDDPLPNVSSIESESSDEDDVVLAAHSSLANANNTMSAPRRIQSTRNSDQALLIKRVSGG